MRNRKGYIILETIVAMIVLTILAGILATALYHRQTGIQHLSDIRAASRLAESALISAQAGPPSIQSTTFQRLNSDAPAGLNWVVVQAGVNGRQSSLVGLVPGVTP